MGEVFTTKNGYRQLLSPGDIYNPLNAPSLQVFRVGVEMEGWGANGEEITGTELYEEVRVAAPDEEKAREIVFEELSFGVRQPTGFSEVHREAQE